MAGELVVRVRHVPAQDGAVDGEQRLLHREYNGKRCKMPLWVTSIMRYALTGQTLHLQPGVDGEAAACGVHAGAVLRVVDVLQLQLLSAVPVTVVNVLPDDRVWPRRPIP